MTERAAPELRYERVPEEERRAFHVSLYPIFEEDERRQGITIPPYNYRCITVAARTADGQIAGGLRAETAWNELHVTALAANPACRVPGTGVALMKHAEELCRRELQCNRIRLDCYDWQPRAYFEDMGYTVFGVQEDFPHGHTKYFLQKVWAAEASGEGAVAAAVHGYAKAATDVSVAEWEATECADALRDWMNADTVARTASTPHPVAPLAPSLFALRVTYADGSFAAGVVCLLQWNELHVNLFAVATSGQRRGVGSAILAKLDEVAREEHREYIGLETSEWQGRPFYEKNGFTCFSTQEGVPTGFMRYRLFRRVAPAA